MTLDELKEYIELELGEAKRMMNDETLKDNYDYLLGKWTAFEIVSKFIHRVVEDQKRE